MGIDITEVIKGSSTKYNFVAHYPGLALADHVYLLILIILLKMHPNVDYIPFLIRVAREVNDRMPEHVRDMIILALNKAGLAIQNSTLGILGILIKPMSGIFR